MDTIVVKLTQNECTTNIKIMNKEALKRRQNVIEASRKRRRSLAEASPKPRQSLVESSPRRGWILSFWEDLDIPNQTFFLADNQTPAKSRGQLQFDNFHEELIMARRSMISKTLLRRKPCENIQQLRETVQCFPKILAKVPNVFQLPQHVRSLIFFSQPFGEVVTV